jgi:hypothetical protein
MLDSLQIILIPNDEKYPKFVHYRSPVISLTSSAQEISPVGIDGNNRLTLFPSFFAVFSGREGR